MRARRLVSAGLILSLLLGSTPPLPLRGAAQTAPRTYLPLVQRPPAQGAPPPLVGLTCADTLPRPAARSAAGVPADLISPPAPACPDIPQTAPPTATRMPSQVGDLTIQYE